MFGFTDRYVLLRWDGRWAVDGPLDARSTFFSSREAAWDWVKQEYGVGELFLFDVREISFPPPPKGPLAQRLAHPAHNRMVLGSNPRGPTKLKEKNEKPQS